MMLLTTEGTLEHPYTIHINKWEILWNFTPATSSWRQNKYKPAKKILHIAIQGGKNAKSYGLAKR